MHKKYQKRLLSLLLVLTLTTGVMYTEYHTAQEVQAIAVVDDIAIILAILAACGVGYVGYEWFNQSDIAGYADEVAKAEESLSRLWDNAVTQFGGDQNPDDFDPDNDNPNEKPPKWEKLKAWAKAHPGATLALGAGGAMATVVTAITPEILKTREEGKVKPEDITYTQDVISKMLEYSNDYPYIVHFYANSTSGYVDMYKTKPIVYKSNNSMVLDNRNIPGNPNPDLSCIHIQPSGSIWIGNGYSNYTLNPGQHTSLLSTNLTIYDSLQDAVNNYGNDSTKYPGTINPASLPLSTDIMDWLDKNPGKDAPEQPLYDNVKIPTQDEVDTFIQDLEKSRDDEDTEDEQQRQTITNNFIQNITNVNPDPAPDPDPTPDPEPTPDPNPDPSPNPPTDLTEEEKGSFLLPESIKKKFPFCIPFDLIDAFTVLKSDTRQAPRIKWRLQSEKYDIDYTFDIDLSVYDEQAELLRTLELLLFIVGLILATRSLIRG
ncbi:hypothetical protein [Blautia marasmi]|uniref:hypothetical protein n=1 Tax=Blautia marasmi TaxID=1917868 RepID=UPI001A9A4CFA|nr:hypothetical protein [Blautia marasmi]